MAGLMAQGSWLMPRGSRLKAHGSWSIKELARGPPGPEPSRHFFIGHEPWATSLEACAMSLEPWASNITGTSRVHVLMLNITRLFRQMFWCRLGQIMSTSARHLVLHCLAICMLLWHECMIGTLWNECFVLEIIMNNKMIINNKQLRKPERFPERV